MYGRYMVTDGTILGQTGRDHFLILYYLRFDITVLSQTALFEKNNTVGWGVLLLASSSKAISSTAVMYSTRKNGALGRYNNTLITA